MEPPTTQQVERSDNIDAQPVQDGVDSKAYLECCSCCCEATALLFSLCCMAAAG
ncbi:hypothetical protein Syun_005280 [Stephania yunnanensis]|uniref:Uncharacterized protein n=1 Tax=Stephania yunnanensis TaxID=152371 RepID=A0AAP0Q234_9MAGN